MSKHSPPLEKITLSVLSLGALFSPFFSLQLLQLFGPVVLFLIFACEQRFAETLPHLLRERSSKLILIFRLFCFALFIGLFARVQIERPVWTTLLLGASLVLLIAFNIRRQRLYGRIALISATALILMAAANESLFFGFACASISMILFAEREELSRLSQVLTRGPWIRLLLILALTYIFIGSWFYFGHNGARWSLPNFAVGWPRNIAALFWVSLSGLLVLPVIRIPSRAVWRWLIVCLGLVISFVAVEGVLRASMPIMIHQDAEAALYRDNSLGYRDVEHELAKPTGTKRILVLGDSVTYGARVKVEEMYSTRIGDLLREANPGIKFEIINISRPGWNTPEELSALIKHGLPLKPDLVILGFVLNDAEPAGPAFKIYPLLPQSLNSQLSWYYLTTFVNFIYNRILQSSSKYPDYEAYLLGLYSEGQPGWETCRANHREMIRVSREAGAPLLCVLFPLSMDFENYTFKSVHQTVTEVMQSNGAEVVDLLSCYSKHPPKDLQVSFMDSHPSALGHGLAAEAAVQKILKTESLLDALGLRNADSD